MTFRNLETPSRVAIATVVANLLINAASTFFANVPVVDGSSPLFGALDMFVRLGPLFAWVVSGVGVVYWFRCAYSNLSLWTTPSSTLGFATAVWFVPIVSLFRPFQLMKELDRESTVERTESLLIGPWWSCWIIGTIIGLFAAIIPASLVLQDLVLLGAGVLLIQIILRISANQVSRSQAPSPAALVAVFE